MLKAEGYAPSSGVEDRPRSGPFVRQQIPNPTRCSCGCCVVVVRDGIVWAEGGRVAGGLRGLGGDFSNRKADVSVRGVEVEFEVEGEGEPAGTNTNGTSRAGQGKTVQRRLIEATG